MTAPEHRTHTITDELAHLRETPHLGLPREQVLGMAMAARAPVSYTHLRAHETTE